MGVGGGGSRVCWRLGLSALPSHLRILTPRGCQSRFFGIFGSRFILGDAARRIHVPGFWSV